MTTQRSDVMGWAVYQELLPKLHPEIAPHLCGLIKFTGDRRRNRRLRGRLFHTTDQTITLKHLTGYSVIRWDELSSESYRKVRAATMGQRLSILGLTKGLRDECRDHSISTDQETEQQQQTGAE